MKGRPVPPRRLPAMADERRIQACLAACEHIATDALESGLVQDGGFCLTPRKGKIALEQ